MPTKQDLEEKVELYKEQIEFLKDQLLTVREEKEQYRLQVERLQDAIINVKAPEAYRDMLADKAVPDTGFTQQSRDHDQQIQDFHMKYLQSIEEPLFRSPEDIDDLLTAGLVQDAVTPDQVSVHGNDES